MVRYAADNDQRSSKYDDLLAAEDKALKSKKGERYCFLLSRIKLLVIHTNKWNRIFDDFFHVKNICLSLLGMHQGKNQKDQTTRRIADVSGDVAKSKQFLPFLQRAGRMQAVVEFIASASRYR